MTKRLPSPVTCLLTIASLVPPLAAHGEAGAKKAATAASTTVVEPVARKLERRTLTLDDASVNTLPEVYVCGGGVTVLTFQVEITDAAAGTAKALFHRIERTDKTVILLPKTDLAAPVPLTVSLVDGTVMTFQLISNPRHTDAHVDVLLALRKRAAADSMAALKGRVSQLQGDLDTCRATAGDAGAGKVAALLLEQSGGETLQAFDRRALSQMAREHRLLVEAKWVYRMMGMTYLLLNVENRDPERQWVLDRATVRLTSGGAQQDIAVKVHLADSPALAPEGAGLVVLAFASVTGARQEIAVTLDEKDGGRSVTLRGIGL